MRLPESSTRSTLAAEDRKPCLAICQETSTSSECDATDVGRLLAILNAFIVFDVKLRS